MTKCNHLSQMQRHAYQHVLLEIVRGAPKTRTVVSGHKNRLRHELLETIAFWSLDPAPFVKIDGPELTYAEPSQFGLDFLRLLQGMNLFDSSGDLFGQALRNT